MEDKKSYYAIIPANVRYDKDLPANAKLLYGEITALCNEKGYCWASNSYFADLYGVSNRSITKWISGLITKGYIKSNITYKDDGKTVDKRYLCIANTPIEEIFHRVGKNLPEGIEENFHTPIEENFQENNTSINNTFNNTINSSSTTSSSNDIEIIIKAWNELNLQQLRSINSSTNRYTMLKARIKEYSLDEVVQAIKSIKGSSFLKGQNKNNWVITFDWFIKPNNFIKVLEGNYRDKVIEKNEPDPSGRPNWRGSDKRL